MRIITPILSAVLASALVAILARLFGDSIPGEGFQSLGNLILLLWGGFVIVPPLAFGVAGWRGGLRRVLLATIIMGVVQLLLFFGVLYITAQLPVSDAAPWLWVAVMVVVVPPISALIALAATGNLTNKTA
jgi:hypothetical protein